MAPYSSVHDFLGAEYVQSITLCTTARQEVRFRAGARDASETTKYGNIGWRVTGRSVFMPVDEWAAPGLPRPGKTYPPRLASNPAELICGPWRYATARPGEIRCLTLVSGLTASRPGNPKEWEDFASG